MSVFAYAAAAGVKMDFQVTFIAEDNFLYMPDYTVMLQRAGIEVVIRAICQDQ